MAQVRRPVLWLWTVEWHLATLHVKLHRLAVGLDHAHVQIVGPFLHCCVDRRVRTQLQAARMFDVVPPRRAHSAHEPALSFSILAGTRARGLVLVRVAVHHDHVSVVLQPWPPFAPQICVPLACVRKRCFRVGGRNIKGRIPPRTHLQNVLQDPERVVFEGQLASNLRIEGVKRLLSQTVVSRDVAEQGGAESAVSMAMLVHRRSLVAFFDVPVQGTHAKDSFAVLSQCSVILLGCVVAHARQRLIVRALGRVTQQAHSKIFNQRIEREDGRDWIDGGELLECSLVHVMAIVHALLICDTLESRKETRMERAGPRVGKDTIALMRKR